LTGSPSVGWHPTRHPTTVRSTALFHLLDQGTSLDAFRQSCDLAQ
jgi:hypothetical protein